MILQVKISAKKVIFSKYVCIKKINICKLVAVTLPLEYLTNNMKKAGDCY